MKEIEELVLCKCGYPEDHHNFHHEFDPQLFIERWEDNVGDLFKLDANDFPAVKIEGKCKVPQCGAIKNLHGPIIKHEFIPDETIFKRTIKFQLPMNTKCRHTDKEMDEKEDKLVQVRCEQTLESHKSMTHAFLTKVDVKGLTKHDIVTVVGKNGQSIVCES